LADCVNTKKFNQPERVLQVLSNSGLLLVDSGFPVEQRTVFGLGGDHSDLAVSLEWRDAAGCQWVADFTEENLLNATVTRNQIALNDSEGEPVCVEFYDLNPGKF
jgi:hypothetical protein